MPKIAPCLWFNGDAEEAANFYVSLLPDSRIEHVQKNVMDSPGGKAGSVLIVEFTLNLTNSANVKTVNVLMNGASGTNIGSYAVTSFATWNGQAFVFAFDGANLKGSLGAALAGGLGGSTTAFASLARGSSG